MTEYLKNVALVGASGNLGSKVLPALIQQGQHNITVISRVESNATFPEGVLVKKGTYDDNGFLESSFAGQDIVIFMLGFAAMKDEDNMIHAAAKAGVKYVIPSEFGSPSEDPAFVEAVPMLAGNLARHDLIRSLGLKYIVVSTNAWLDYALDHNLFGIDIAQRKATLYADSNAFTTTTTTKVGTGIAKLLALPIDVISNRYANGYFYLSSICITQPNLFEAVLLATHTKRDEWTVEISSVGALLAESQRASDFLSVVAATTYRVGNYSAKAAQSSELLGLEQESVETVIGAAVDAMNAGAKTNLWLK